MHQSPEKHPVSRRDKYESSARTASRAADPGQAA